MVAEDHVMQFSGASMVGLCLFHEMAPFVDKAGTALALPHLSLQDLRIAAKQAIFIRAA